MPSYVTPFETVRAVSLLLSPDGLEWLTEVPEDADAAPLVVHLSCMAHFTPHIPFLAQQILRRLDLDCVIVGGPENCCGALHWHFGDEDLERQMVAIARSGFQRLRPQTVLSICPDCDEMFGRHDRRKLRYHHANISELFLQHLDRLKPMMRPLDMRVVMHAHHINDARRADARNMRQILDAIPGLEVLPAEHSAGPGIHCQTMHPMPPEDQERMFAEARDLGADAVVVPYHSCYRQHCKMQLKHGVEVHHYFSLIALALGIEFTEPFKELRLLDDFEAVVAKLQPRIKSMGFDEDTVRPQISRAIFC